MPDRNRRLTDVTIVVPWRRGCVHQEDTYRWVRDRWAALHPSWTVVEGASPDGPFSRTAAIVDGASRVADGIVVAHDADLVVDLTAAVAAVAAGAAWAVPHLNVHRLSAESSDMFKGGYPLAGLGLDISNRQDRRPYRGHECGGVVVMRRDVLASVPPDPRFQGWGQEDDTWALALRALVGPPWRGDADLVHLWHPPQERTNRVVGNDENRKLLNRYQRAARKPDLMRALIEEVA